MIGRFFRSFGCCFSAQQDGIVENDPEENQKIQKDSLGQDHYSTRENGGMSIKSEMKKGGELTSEDMNKVNKPIKIDPNNSSYEKMLIDPKYIRSDEEGKITFTKNGILKFIESLHSYDDYSLIYDKNNFRLEGRNGSMITDKLDLTKQTFKCKTSDFINGVNLRMLRNLIFDYPTRKRWDSTVKDIKVLEGNEEAYICQNIAASPVFFISERDTVDKRFEFIHDNVFYNFTTSIEEGIIPHDKGVVRCKYYICVNIFEIRGENVFFTVYSQFDGKAILPQSFLNLTLPYILDNWYHDLVKTACKEEFKSA